METMSIAGTLASCITRRHGRPLDGGSGGGRRSGQGGYGRAALAHPDTTARSTGRRMAGGGRRDRRSQGRARQGLAHGR
jgi:hypothetical protein